MTEPKPQPQLGIRTLVHKGEIILLFSQACTDITLDAAGARGIGQALIAFADQEDAKAGKGSTKQ